LCLQSLNGIKPNRAGKVNDFKRIFHENQAGFSWCLRIKRMREIDVKKVSCHAVFLDCRSLIAAACVSRCFAYLRGSFWRDTLELKIDEREQGTGASEKERKA
jgi:hypothetical protein